MKVGIIRCMQTEDFCPGTTDFRMIREKKGAFEGVEEDIEIIGFINCGGCPGKKAVLRARELVNRGADYRFCFLYPKRDADRLCLSFRQKDEGCYPERFRRWHPADRLYALGRSGSWWKRHKKRGH